MASKAVFADTSFFFALVARRDPVHQAAVAAYTKVLRGHGRVFTTDYVIDETLTLTKARIDIATALALLDRIEASEAVAMEDIAPQRFVAAKAYFRRHADHGYSFTDCTSFVLMRELKIAAALTTDRHFKEAGFEVLLPTA
ncbi:MAG: type II toxin-antitoxin system VapC family toxin [Proteobacteria bacterium]|nr:type II toxin-antitoxin system VapC family toxin [Pseudomonadota bacterium]